MALPHSVADTQLGLSAAELHTFRQHQAIALGTPAASTAGHSSSAATRGRGSARSGASSRAASAASSAAGGGGRLMLDAGSLNVLGAYFERLMARIQDRVDHVSLDARLPKPCDTGENFRYCVECITKFCSLDFHRGFPAASISSLPPAAMFSPCSFPSPLFRPSPFSQAR